ncbi:MAG: hypothetical protein IJV05_08515 [Muribaculaceae bacterium]|nr:hypothetical protein [Muribaculaceae bacterium]
MKKLKLILSMMIALVGLNANAAIYIVGDGPLGGWACDGGNEMTANGDGTYTYKIAIAEDAASTSVYFVFADNRAASGDWATFNGQYRIGPTDGNVEVPIEVTATSWMPTQKAGGDNGAYYFTGTKGQTYTVTYDEINSQFKVEGYVAPITEFTYTVAGSSTELFGTAWSATNTDNDMTLVNGLYTWSIDRAELTTAGFSFKVVRNHDWGTAYPSSNYVQTIGKHGYYKVVITFNEETKEITCTPTLLEEIIDEVDPIYTVAGAPAALFGTEWTPALVENEMTKGNDGIYTWTKNNVALTAGNVEFKVVLGHDWGVEYPSSNYVATINANGNYNVTITFNPENQEITFNAAVVEETEDFYTVAGAPEAIFGAEWNPAYAANNMTLVDGLYIWIKEDVELAAGTFIEFKVVKNANWSTCWPADNYEYTVEEAGTYDLTITFNPETNEVTFTPNKQGEEPVVLRGDVDQSGHVSIDDVTALIDYLLSGAEAPASADCDLSGNVSIDDVTALIDYLLSGHWPAVEMVYTVVGSANVFGSEWNPADEANNMVKGANGVYTWSKTGVTLYGNFEFKVVGNHDWSIYEWPIGMYNWIANVAEEGVYDILITFDPEAADADRITCTLTKTGDVAPVEHTYTVAGTDNLFDSSWNQTDTANDMVKGEDGIYTWAKDGCYLEQTEVIEFKVVQDHAWDYAWPSSNYYYEVAETGTYSIVIKFDPNTQEVSFYANKLF